jgi:Lar family restriction alleviation protein
MNQPPEIKECPFCGGLPESYTKQRYWLETYGIRCTDCGGGIPAHYETLEGAVKAWNKRE